MQSLIHFLFFFILSTYPLNLPKLEKSNLQKISNQIFLNETGGNKDYLLWWSPKEPFLSLGIGHAIWLNRENPQVFESSFPQFIQFCKTASSVKVSTWMQVEDCPWSTKEAFEKAKEKQDPRYLELKAFIENTQELQAAFIIQRAQIKMKELETHIAADKGPEATLLRKNYKKLRNFLNTPTGVYCAVDYINFKNNGLNPKESYQGHRWGLLQVLAAMDWKQPIDGANFSDAAYAMLEKRVKLSPPDKKEERFLPGWKKRCESYRI